MAQRVAITGLGSLCGLGENPDALFAGLLAGQTAVRHLPALVGTALSVGPLVSASLPDEDNSDGGAILSGQPRAGLFLLHSAQWALRQAGLGGPGAGDGRRIAVCVATTLGEKSPWLVGIESKHKQVEPPSLAYGCGLLAEQLATRLGAERVRAVSTACCSSNTALSLSLSWLRRGLCDVVVCGGVDVLSPFVVSGFRSLRAQSADVCRPFDRRRSGVNLGEASACVILETESHARRRGQPILAFLAGAGLSQDAHHMTAPDPQGRGALLAMQRALFDAELSTEAVDFVSSHGTGTPFNDQMEGRAIQQLLGDRCLAVPVNSIKGSVGHTLGAAGLLEAVMAVQVLSSQKIPQTVGLEEVDPAFSLDLVQGKPRESAVRCVLSTASGFGGENAAVVIASASDARSLP